MTRALTFGANVGDLVGVGPAGERAGHVVDLPPTGHRRLRLVNALVTPVEAAAPSGHLPAGLAVSSATPTVDPSKPTKPAPSSPSIGRPRPMNAPAGAARRWEGPSQQR